MFNEIDFSKIDTSGNPPQDDTERQYYYMAKLADMVKERALELGRPVTYCLQTFGCQMNEKQSEVVGVDGQPLSRRTVEREKDAAIQGMADRIGLYEGRRKKG